MHQVTITPTSAFESTAAESMPSEPTAVDATTAESTTNAEALTTTSAETVSTPAREPGFATELGVERLVRSDFSQLEAGRVGLITNQVSAVDGRHLIDWMHDSSAVELVTIFAAEHGVRGVAGAGEPIGDGVDDGTGVPIRSLYGATRQPTLDMLDGIDTIVFDLQDVGTRYYTYTATMGLAMQAAAAANLRFVVLDRPNPLGRVVEGDLRTDQQTSFISQYPTPSLHGLTAGELALMIVGEAWLEGLDDLDLDIIEMVGWEGEVWEATQLEWVPPSPGLQTTASAATYPTIVWFEATTLSYGAGTDLAFQAVGAPWLDADAVVADLRARNLPGVEFAATDLRPIDVPDVATDPRFEGQSIPGVQVIITDVGQFEPSATGLHLLAAVIATEPTQPVIDRGAVFDLLAGTDDVRRQLLSEVSVDDIVSDWDDVAAEFEARSFAYTLY